MQQQAVGGFPTVTKQLQTVTQPQAQVSPEQLHKPGAPQSKSHTHSFSLFSQSPSSGSSLPLMNRPSSHACVHRQRLHWPVLPPCWPQTCGVATEVTEQGSYNEHLQREAKPVLRSNIIMRPLEMWAIFQLHKAMCAQYVMHAPLKMQEASMTVNDFPFSGAERDKPESSCNILCS